MENVKTDTHQRTRILQAQSLGSHLRQNFFKTSVSFTNSSVTEHALWSVYSGQGSHQIGCWLAVHHPPAPREKQERQADCIQDMGWWGRAPRSAFPPERRGGVIIFIFERWRSVRRQLLRNLPFFHYKLVTKLEREKAVCLLPRLTFALLLWLILKRKTAKVVFHLLNIPRAQPF